MKKRREKCFILNDGTSATVSFCDGCDFDLSLEEIELVYYAFLRVAKKGNYVSFIRCGISCCDTYCNVIFKGLSFDVAFYCDVRFDQETKSYIPNLNAVFMLNGNDYFKVSFNNLILPI